jgi:hypothetical protein
MSLDLRIEHPTHYYTESVTGPDPCFDHTQGGSKLHLVWFLYVWSTRLNCQGAGPLLGSIIVRSSPTATIHALELVYLDAPASRFWTTLTSAHNCDVH